MAINPSNSYFEQQWDMKIINAPEAYDLLRGYSFADGYALGSANDRTFGRAQIVIAVMDTGIQTTPGAPVNSPTRAVNAAFQGYVSDGSLRLAAAYDFHRKGPDPLGSGNDMYIYNHHDIVGGSHGSACASIVAGAVKSASYSSSSAIAGVAGNCRLIGLLWGNNPSSEDDLAFVWASNLVDLGYFRNKYKGSIPSGGSYRLPVGVSMDILTRSITRKEFRESAFAVSVFGRNGRGVLLFNSAGNKGEDIKNPGFNPRWNLVAATKVENGVVDITTERRASYSNFGSRVDICAPAGGGQNDSGFDENRTLAASVRDGGTFEDVGSNSIWNVTLTKVNNTTYSVAPNNLYGITKGHFVEIQSPSSNQYQIREITGVTIVPGVSVHINISGKFNSFGGAINLAAVPARIAYAYAETTSALSTTGLTSINLNSTVGLKAGQKVFIDDNANRELVTVASVVNSTSITITSPGTTFVHNTVPTRVTKGYFGCNIVKILSTDESGTVFVVNSVEGFFVGQLVRLYATLTSSSGSSPTTFNEIVSVNSIDAANLQLGLHVGLSGSWTGSISALGGGEYDSTFNGTSSACPHAAGVAALVLSANQNKLNWLEAKHIIHETAKKIDLTNVDATGKWKDESGNPVFSNTLSLLGTTMTATLGAAFPGNSNTLQLTSVAGLQKEMVIQVTGGPDPEYAAIATVNTTTNVITLDRKIMTAMSSGATITIGRKAHRSLWYGRGRVDAARAVEMARSWNVNERDLWIRDFNADTGVAHTMPAAIDSPDIWVRNVNPSADPNYLTHQLPDAYSDSWIYVCVRNRGTQPSLPGSEIVLTITDTQDPIVGIDFAFPDRWIHAFKPNNLGFDEITGMISRQHVKIITTYTDGKGKYSESSDNTHDYESADFVHVNNPLLPAMADPKNPQILPSIPAGGSYVAIFPWPRKTKVRQPIGRTFLKVHITPFDGDDTVAGLDVQSNNNLTFKQIWYQKIELKDGSTLEELNAIDVDTLGTTVLQPINIMVQNILPAYVNNTSIKMTMQLTDGTADQICEFKHNGTAWAPVAPFPAWVTMSAPVLSGSNPPYQERTSFDGNLILTNLYGKLTFEVKVTDGTNTVVERTIVLPINAVAPAHPDGAAGTDTFKFHTFTDLDQLPVQVPANKYGPISSTEYRTAAMYTGIASGTVLKAYAVTRGRIIIQEVTGNPNLINLILQPDDQPDSDYGRIKYFVYRGIKATSYLVGPGGAVKPDNPTVNNDFLDRHWALRAILDAKELALNPGYVSPGVKRDDLGLVTLPATQPGTTPISELFNSNRFQIATRGWEIGEFDTSGLYGFQIIVDGPYHEPVLDDVRSLDPKVTITYTGGQPQYSAGQREDIATLLKREQILSYMDPVAFLGQSWNVIFVKNSGSPTPVKVADYVDLYNNVLIKFATRDKVYVDIRNEVNHSLNFFGNYGGPTPPNHATVKFLNNTNAYVDKNYDTNGWPILILDATEFPAGNPSYQVKLGLKFPKGDNVDPMLYVPNVCFHGKDVDDKKLKFKELTPGVTHTSEVELGIEHHDVGNVVLPTAVKIVYCKRYDLGNLPPAVFPATKIIRDDIWDTIFTPGDIHLVPRTNHVVWDSRSELRYSGWTSKNDFDFALQTGRAIDSIGEVAYAYVLGPAEFQASTSEKITHVNVDLINGSVQARSFLEHLTKKKLVTVAYEEIDENPSNFPCLRVQSKDGNHSNRKIKPSANDIVLYAYTAAEKATIDTAISTANFLPGSSRYYMAQAHKLKKNLFSHPYFEMELAVQGIVYNAGTFTYQVVLVPTGVKLYSVDGRSYFSIAYATDVKTQIDTTPY